MDNCSVNRIEETISQQRHTNTRCLFEKIFAKNEVSWKSWDSCSCLKIKRYLKNINIKAPIDGIHTGYEKRNVPLKGKKTILENEDVTCCFLEFYLGFWQ